MEQLREWVSGECEKRNLTWRDASLRAGVNAGAISAIMNGQRPGLGVCKALARSFSTPTEYVLRLAGHLPMRTGEGDPELAAIADQLTAIWHDIKQLDPASAERLSGLAVLQSEMVLAAMRSDTKANCKEETTPTKV